jgi:hypothetical protein
LGKGRKQRATPLTTQSNTVLREWLKERDGQPDQPLLSTSRGQPLSRDAIALLLTKRASAASHNRPALANKTVSPHVLRHAAAMNLLHAVVATGTLNADRKERRGEPCAGEPHAWFNAAVGRKQTSRLRGAAQAPPADPTTPTPYRPRSPCPLPPVGRLFGHRPACGGTQEPD